MPCECGSYKTYGTKQGEMGHSDWCYWAPSQERKATLTCEGFMEPCAKKPTMWVKYSESGMRFFYCHVCSDNIVCTNSSFFSCGTV